MRDESKGGRSGNEIASTILNWTECNIPNSAVKKITIWSDNCYGQNQKLSVVMIFFWIMRKYTQIKVINQKCFLKGHTHMEADMVHTFQ